MTLEGEDFFLSHKSSFFPSTKMATIVANLPVTDASSCGESVPIEVELPSPILALDLSMVKMKLMDAEEGLGWSGSLVNAVEVEYRKFLYLNLLRPTGDVVPSKLVDDMWHFHILDTRAYAEDCNAVFGNFFHHFPYWGMRGEEDFHSLQEGWVRTLRFYEEVFGRPPAHELWPSCARCPNCGSGSCFHPEGRVLLENGDSRLVTEVRIGDNVAKGGRVTSVLMHEFVSSKEMIFDYKGVVVTGSHAVLENGSWVRVFASEGAKYAPTDSTPNVVYNFVTEHHRLVMLGSNGAQVLFADNSEVEEEQKEIDRIHAVSLARLNSSI